MPTAGPQGMQTNWTGRLRPVKSVESLVSPPLFIADNLSTARNGTGSVENLNDSKVLKDMEEVEKSKSSPVSPVTDVHVDFHPQPPSSPGFSSISKTHNR